MSMPDPVSPSPQSLLAVMPWDHSQGPADAPVTLLEYGDYECPYCGKAFPILKQLRAALGDQLRLVFRHFPLNNVHPHASVAAQAAEAAGAQGKFWEMHEMLFEHQDALDSTDFEHYALRIGLEVYHFQSELSSNRFARRIARDYESGVKVNVKKTPTLFINQIKYEGALEYEAIHAAVRMAGAK